MARDTILERFVPADPPVVSPELQPIVEYVYREHQRLANMLSVLASGYIEVSHAAPERLDHGLIRLADGTNWNPGSGGGLYWYDSTTASWKFLG